MYIDPFWAGVMATIFSELVVIFVAAFVRITKHAGGKNDHES